MSTPSEQKRALKNTRVFLKFILTDRSKWTKRQLRDKADLCYKHFPFLDDDGTPGFSNDEWTTTATGGTTDEIKMVKCRKCSCVMQRITEQSFNGGRDYIYYQCGCGYIQ